MPQAGPEQVTGDRIETTHDRFLGGLIEVEQPKSGFHRSGLDAILLAATLPRDAQGTLTDLGAGVGVAGLAALARCPGLSLTLVDNDPTALALAARNAERSCARPAGRPAIRIVDADATLKGRARRAAGLEPQSADFVITNPPYNHAGRSRPSPRPGRARAHAVDDSSLRAWIDTAIWLVRPKGTLTLIVRTDRLPLVLGALTPALGEVSVLPVQARAGEAAKRVLVRGRLGSRAPFRLLPSLILHHAAGPGFTPQAAAILENGRELSFSAGSGG